jgi:TolA-binding protein
LQACGAGAESAAMALRSLQELQRRAGSPAALSAAEALLRQRPTALPVWLWRARELLASENDRRGLDELRSLLAYAQDPELQLAAVTLAACQGEQQAADAARLLALPPALLRSPRAALPRGLLRLRAGDAPGAVGELLQAAPTADGAHLYFAAVALLQRGATGDLAAAEQRFAQLARDYPSSSLARYAGNFARQLAGR